MFRLGARRTRPEGRPGDGFVAWLRSTDCGEPERSESALGAARAEAVRAWLAEALDRKPERRRPDPAGAASQPGVWRDPSPRGRRIEPPRPRHLPPRSRRRRLRRMRVARKRRTVVLTILGIVFAIVASVAGATLLGGSYIASDCGGVTLRPPPLAATSFLYTGDGALLGAVPSESNRQPVQLKAMSPWLVDATLAIEDRRFFRHGGIDYRAIVRAVRANLDAGTIVQGGSTITQQLVRNLYIGNQELSLSRKLREACLAIVLERAWPKERILELYLNRIFYGARAYGVEAASRTYFHRHAAGLTLVQAALLAGLPQGPTLYNPFVNPRGAKVRRNEVLLAMRKAGNITPRQYRAAVRAPVRLRPGASYYSSSRDGVFFGYALHESRARLGEQAIAQGLRIRTTLDPRLQGLATAALRSYLGRTGDPAAALVAIDPRTGAIRAMEAVTPGKRLSFNLAYQSRRQAGSAFKPFTLATALEQHIALSSVWNGPPSLSLFTPTCRNGRDPWYVHNFADETAGTMNLEQATAHSVNTIFAQLIADVGPARVAATAHRLGVTSPLKPVCSLTLGSEGVSPLEMASAYATFAAGGVYRRPTTIASATTNGSVVARLDPAGRRALRPEVAADVTRALQAVVEYGTGTAAQIGRPAAGKTGTAEAYHDAWFCGYVPQLAACVWVGYPAAEVPLLNIDGFPQVFGGSIPARIWQRFMAPAVAPLRTLAFR